MEGGEICIAFLESDCSERSREDEIVRSVGFGVCVGCYGCRGDTEGVWHCYDGCECTVGCEMVVLLG